MWGTTKPVKEITELEWTTLVKDKEIKVSSHATDHISAAQRKVFKDQDLIDMINREMPRKAYLQENDRYRAYFRKQDGYRELIIEISKNKVDIVTFMDLPELPKTQPTK